MSLPPNVPFVRNIVKQMPCVRLNAHGYAGLMCSWNGKHCGKFKTAVYSNLASMLDCPLTLYIEICIGSQTNPGLWSCSLCHYSVMSHGSAAESYAVKASIVFTWPTNGDGR